MRKTCWIQLLLKSSSSYFYLWLWEQKRQKREQHLLYNRIFSSTNRRSDSSYRDILWLISDQSNINSKIITYFFSAWSISRTWLSCSSSTQGAQQFYWSIINELLMIYWSMINNLSIHLSCVKFWARLSSLIWFLSKVQKNQLNHLQQSRSLLKCQEWIDRSEVWNFLNWSLINSSLIKYQLSITHEHKHHNQIVSNRSSTSELQLLSHVHWHAFSSFRSKYALSVN